MQHIKIDPAAETKLSGVKLAALRGTGMRVVKDGYNFEVMVENTAAEINKRFAEQPISSDPVVSAVRRMYRVVGWEPTKYRPSSEAMVRRLLKGQGLYSINNLVDLLNIVSLSFRLPAGLYDTEKIAGQPELGVGRGGESYEGLSKKLIHAEGKIILRDDAGVFGNPTADSRRTAISENTNNILALFFVPQGVDTPYIEKMIEQLRSYYQPFCDGTMQTSVQGIG